MDIRPFTPNDTQAWANLLASSFERKPQEMVQLLEFLQRIAPLISYGAWDGNRLAAQYSCLIRPLHLPGHKDLVVKVGVSLNMAVHPNYRGHGLVKKVAAPVYETVKELGAIAGVGFSNAEGVKVDRRSKGYGYRVIGRLQPSIAYLVGRPQFEPLKKNGRFPKNCSVRYDAT